MKGVIYARYSSDSQREESIEGQIRDCTAYAERMGIIVLDCYVDRALSAKTDNRPDFQRMIADSAKGLFDCIIVWKLDRFARDRYDSAHYKHLLKKNGVRVISATEPISDSPEGQLLESLLEGMAQYYSAELAVKVVRGMTDNALKCKFNGGSVPFGYVIDKDRLFQPDEAVADVVPEIFQKYLDGATMREIVSELNDRGIRRKGGKEFTIASISDLLRNRRYIGEYRFRDIVIADGIPALVDKELFERVQEQIAKNNKTPARHKAEEDYLLASKLFCGKCGSVMIGESGTSRNGSTYRYYKCSAAKKRRACDKKPLRKHLIEDTVVSWCMSLIMDEDIIESIADTALAELNKENVMIPALKKQLADTERGINNLIDAIQQGIFSASTKQRLDQLEQMRDDYIAQIAREELGRPKITKEQIIFWLTRFRTFDMSVREHRQRLIDVLVNAVYVYDDYLLLICNYTDNAAQASRLEVKAAIGSDLCRCGAPKKKTSRTRKGWLVFFR